MMNTRINSWEVFKLIKAKYPKNQEILFAELPKLKVVMQTGCPPRPFCFVMKLPDSCIIYDGITGKINEIKKAGADIMFKGMNDSFIHIQKNKEWIFVSKTEFVIHDSSFCNCRWKAVESFENYLNKKFPKKKYGCVRKWYDAVKHPMPVVLGDMVYWAAQLGRTVLLIKFESRKEVYKTTLENFPAKRIEPGYSFCIEKNRFTLVASGNDFNPAIEFAEEAVP